MVKQNTIKNPLVEAMSAKNRLPKDVQKQLTKDGWTIYDFHMEKPAGKLWVNVEFCLGDFCVGLFSAKGRWLLEPKYRAENFAEAIMAAVSLQARVEAGDKWTGEDN